MTEIDDLSNEIVRAVRTWTEETKEKIEQAKKETANELKNDLKRLDHPKLTGDYRKGWRVKKKGKKYIVHNATEYRLTHLLEHGHAKRGGGRVEGRPHIAPAAHIAEADYLNAIEDVIEG